ncbi:hypothetical protein L9F63_024050, partial [Diploptera punctata]
CRSPTPPQYVFWYHNDRMINYDTSRGGITVETEPGPKTQSRLTIRDAHDTDSGNYTCSASNTEPASIYVFVSEGDKMAAIQRRKTSSGSVVLFYCECIAINVNTHIRISKGIPKNAVPLRHGILAHEQILRQDECITIELKIFREFLFEPDYYLVVCSGVNRRLPHRTFRSRLFLQRIDPKMLFVPQTSIEHFAIRFNVHILQI